MSEAVATVTSYTISRLPDTSADHIAWSITVEAAGHGRWAVRNLSRCLNKSGEWEFEPQPSERKEKWLRTVRWDSAEEAIEAAKQVEPTLTWNGMTPADVLADQGRWSTP